MNSFQVTPHMCILQAGKPVSAQDIFSARNIFSLIKSFTFFTSFLKHWCMQWCQRLEADHGMDLWIWQSLDGPSFRHT